MNKSTVKRILNETTRLPAQAATVISVDIDRVAIRIGSSPNTIKNVEVLGDAQDLLPGCEVRIVWIDRRPVVISGGGSYSTSGAGGMLLISGLLGGVGGQVAGGGTLTVHDHTNADSGGVLTSYIRTLDHNLSLHELGTVVPHDVHSALSGLGGDDHGQYMHNSSARTVTAQHSFSPGSAQAPFLLGANAQGQLVTGLNADKLDGLDAATSGANAHVLSTDASGNAIVSGTLGVGVSAPSSSTALTLTGLSSLSAWGGANLLTADGTFATSTGWTVGAGWTISGNAAHATGQTASLSAATSATSTVAPYRITFDVTATTSGSGFTVSLGGAVNPLVIYTTGTYNIYIKTLDTTGTLLFALGYLGTWVGTIDNVVVSGVTVSSNPEFQIYSSDGAGSPMHFRAGSADKLNISIGINSGRYNTPTSANNTLVGHGAGQFNTGSNNTAFGMSALYYNTGNTNTGVGALALYNNIANANTAVGYQALFTNTIGTDNAAFGYLALRYNTVGGRNTAVGLSSLTNNVNGSYHTAIGNQSGLSITGGMLSLFLGYGAGNNASQKVDATNQIVIGAQAFGTKDNQVTLGPSTITETLLRGMVGINTASPASALTVTGSGSFTTWGGSNLLSVDGTFASATGWTVGAGWTISGGVAAHDNTGQTDTISAATTATSTTAIYRINIDMTNAVAGAGIRLNLGGTDSIVITNSQAVYFKPVNTSGALTITPVYPGNWVGSVDNIVVNAVATGSVADLMIYSSDGTSGAMQFRNSQAGNMNLGIGVQSARYIAPTSVYNTLVGHYSGQFVTGSYNTALGSNTLTAAPSSNNTAIGASALNITNAGNNTAVGAQSQVLNVSGDRNVSLGTSTLHNNVSSTHNTAVGHSALYYNLAGSNVGVGAYASYSLTAGTQNVHIGYYAGYHASQKVDAVNQIVIGSQAYGTGDNQVTLGNSSITETVLRGTVQMNGNLLPVLNDTYDLGSSAKLWRKGWLSEMDAVLFAKNTISLLGGWLLVTKNEGALVSEVVPATTNIDFGVAITINDFVILRAAGKVEYMKVTALVSGTTYTVTRNLDGSGADTWAAGTPFAVLGNNGNGRIELNAYDSPRLSIIKQAATYNAQTELIRLGDLNGMPGVSIETYGIYIGDASNYLKYDGAALTVAGNGSGLTSINGGNIQTGTITATQIASDTITANQIAANAITTSELNALAVTATKIAANTITAAQIAAGTITANEIAADTITASNIAANAITTSELAAGAVTAAKIAAGTITANEIAADTITAGNIAAGAITASELAANSVVAGKIQAGTIVAADIAAGTITSTQISGTTLSAIKAYLGSLTVDGDLTITSGKLLAGTAGAARTELNASGLSGYNSSNVLQTKIDANTGALLAGGGLVRLDANGMVVTNTGTGSYKGIKFIAQDIPGGYPIGSMNWGGAEGNKQLSLGIVSSQEYDVDFGIGQTSAWAKVESFTIYHPTYSGAGQLIVDGCVSAASIAVTSTTKVTNLNADMVDGAHWTDWTAYSPSYGGFSSNPTTVARYCQLGKMVWLQIEMTANGTSNANTLTVGLPVTASNNAGNTWRAMAFSVDNGVSQTSPGRVFIGAGASVVTCYKAWDATVLWTTSGQKSTRFEIFYEAA